MPPDGDDITLGFDGSPLPGRHRPVATHVATGHQWPIGIWQRPPRVETWEVPVDDVDAAVDGAFARWKVWRLYADPPYWETSISAWAGKYGKERVVEWWTLRQRQMAAAVRAYAGAIAAGELSHDGHALFAEHVGNTVRRELTLRDDAGQRCWTVQKERPDSPRKIDAAVAGVLSWEARQDALREGVGTGSRSRWEREGEEILIV
jgi:hypothetical protein